MKSFTLLLTSLLCLLSVLALAENDEASIARFKVRAKYGYTYFTGYRTVVTNDIDEETAGLDFTFRLVDHVDIGVTAQRVFLAAGSQVYVAGITPQFGLDYERIHLYAGLILGLISVHDQYPLLPTVDFTRPAAGLVSGVDITIIKGLFANVSTQYVKAFGPENKFGALGLTTGLGYQF